MKVRCKEDVDNFKKNVVYNCDEINKSYIVHNEKFNEATKYWSEEALKIEFEIIEEKESDEMEKTFDKVIQDKVVGHVWKQINKISGVDRIEIKEYGPRIYLKENRKDIGFTGTKFKLIKQPVTFEEVLNSNKRCKVEHELIKKICETDISMDYEKFDNLMYFLSNCLNEGELKEIIKNGKWYLED